MISFLKRHLISAYEFISINYFIFITAITITTVREDEIPFPFLFLLIFKHGIFEQLHDTQFQYSTHAGILY